MIHIKSSLMISDNATPDRVGCGCWWTMWASQGGKETVVLAGVSRGAVLPHRDSLGLWVDVELAVGQELGQNR